MIIALWAALAMVATDILGTLLVQAEARNRAHLSAILDSAGWLFSIATLSISVAAINGHDLKLKIVVLAAVTVANYFGSYAGVIIGQRFIANAKAPGHKTGR
jgi:hypothetical protein